MLKIIAEAKKIWSQVILVMLSEDPPDEIICNRDWGVIRCTPVLADKSEWDVAVHLSKSPTNLKLNIDITGAETHDD